MFRSARRSWPTYSVDKEQIRLGFPKGGLFGPGRPSAAFYPFDSSLIEHGAPQVVLQNNGRIELLLRRSAIASDPKGTLDGLLIVEGSATAPVKSHAFDVFARGRQLRVTRYRHADLLSVSNKQTRFERTKRKEERNMISVNLVLPLPGVLSLPRRWSWR